MRALRISLWLILSLIVSGCSSLFYYPTHTLHVDLPSLKPGPEDVFFDVEGEKLNGWYFHQASGKKTKAVILFYHGNGQNISSQFAYLHWILNQPYDFFIFDYEGYGRSTGSPSPEKTARDGAAALEWLHKREPNLPIIIFGQSLGGIIALRNMVDLKGKYPIPLIVIDSSFTSYQTVARRVAARHWMLWPFQWLPYLIFSDHYAPEGELARLAPTPLVIVHGDADQVVPYSCGEDLFAEAPQPKEFWRVPGGRHTDLFEHPEIKEKFLAKLKEVLKK